MIALIVQTSNFNRNKVFCIGLLPDSELGYGVIITIQQQSPEDDMDVLFLTSYDSLVISLSASRILLLIPEESEEGTLESKNV